MAKTTKKPNYRRRDYRCSCGRLIMRAYLGINSHIALRCPKCGKAIIYKSNGGRDPLLKDKDTILV